jgi:hypothetical protein
VTTSSRFSFEARWLVVAVVQQLVSFVLSQIFAAEEKRACLRSKRTHARERYFLFLVKCLIERAITEKINKECVLFYFSSKRDNFIIII